MSGVALDMLLRPQLIGALEAAGGPLAGAVPEGTIRPELVAHRTPLIPLRLVWSRFRQQALYTKYKLEPTTQPKPQMKRTPRTVND